MSRVRAVRSLFLSLLLVLALGMGPGSASAQLQLPGLSSEDLDAAVTESPRERVESDLEATKESLEARYERLAERSRFVLERLDQRQRNLNELQRELEERRNQSEASWKNRLKPKAAERLSQILIQSRALDQLLTRISENWTGATDELAAAIEELNRQYSWIADQAAAIEGAQTTERVEQVIEQLQVERRQVALQIERIDASIDEVRAEEALHRQRLDEVRRELDERDRAMMERLKEKRLEEEQAEAATEPDEVASGEEGDDAVLLPDEAALALAEQETLSRAEQELRTFDDELDRLRVRYQERLVELDRVKQIRLESERRGLALRTPVLAWAIRSWEARGEVLAQREEGGLLGKQRGLVNGDAVAEALSYSQELVLEPAETLRALNQRIHPREEPRKGTNGALFLVALLGGFGMWLALRLRTRVRAMEPRTRGEETALRALRAALPLIPVSLVCLPLIWLGVVTEALAPLYRFMGWFAPVSAAAVAVGLAMFPSQGSENMTAQVARYARMVVRVGVGLVGVIGLAYTLLPLFGFPEEVLLLVRGLALGWLLLVWLALLVRKGEILNALGAAGDDPDEGLIKAGIRRFYRVFWFGPAAVYVLYVSGYTNLASFLIQGGLVTMAVFLLAPWVHEALRDLAAKLLGYPNGGGPFALEPAASKSAYRVAAPAILLFVGGVSALLIAAGWNSGRRLESVPRMLWHPFYEIGGSAVSVGSLLLLGLTVVLTLVVGRQLTKLLNRYVYPVYDLDRGMRATMDTLAGYVVLALGVIVSLDVVGLGIGFLAVFAGVVGIGVGFGSQTLASNFISGLILLFARPVAVDDVIEVNGVTGRVVRISSYATVVRTLDNLTVIVPNSDVIGGSVTNWTVDDPKVRLQVGVGVAYGSDVALVQRLLIQAASEEPRVLRRPAPAVRFDNFGDSSLDFTLLPWTDDPDNRFVIASAIRRRVDELFRQNGVEIPFPQRDLHLRTGDATLDVALKQGLEVRDEDGKVLLEADPEKQKAARKKGGEKKSSGKEKAGK